MKREYPESPIIGVGGVIFHGPFFLLVKRNQDPGKGDWSLPGGVVELGETLTDALKREIQEEISVGIEIGGLARLLDRIVYDQDKKVQYHYVIADYWGWKISGEPQPASDVSDACFVELTRVEKMGLQREVEETILTAVRMRDNHGERLLIHE